MATIYFPSCRFTALSPESSWKTSEYIRRHYGWKVVGCCRPGHRELTGADTAICICNTCAAICSEDSAAQVISIWELLLTDRAFHFRDLNGERLALQDCWRAHDKPEVQDAVREILRRMHADVVELPENRERTRFCGTSLLDPLPAENARLAPRRFVQNAPGVFQPHSPEDKVRLMQAHAAAIPADKVVCYCVPCTQGIRQGGKQGIHLMDLIWGIDG